MKIKDSNKFPTPLIQIDNSLEKYKGTVVFKKQLEAANKTLQEVGVPKAKKRN